MLDLDVADDASILRLQALPQVMDEHEAIAESLCSPRGCASLEAVAVVLRENLAGLEIDGRCVQIAAFTHQSVI